MRTLALLFVLLGLPLVAANAQEADAPEGAVIDAVEISGFSLYSLSPGLQKDINSLVGSPLNREGLNQLASRIEQEQPEVVAAVRGVSRPDGKARVIFLVARISDDTDLTENINARYIVETVDVEGPYNEISQQLRDDLQKLVGRRLDTDEAERLQERLEKELPGRDVARRISKGSQTGRIRVVFEIFEEPWIRFAPTRSKLVYHSQQGWSGVLDIPMSSSRSRHRFTAGVAFNDIDELIEEYSGFRLAFESRVIGTEKLGARLEFSRYNQTWEDATLTALASNPGIPELYRNRLTFEPTATFAFNPRVRINGGISISELESLSNSPNSQMANAWLFGISGDHLWQGSNDVRQRAEASYQIRAAVKGLDSDLVYKRHLGQARYQFEQGRSEAIASLSLGYITGDAPLFERFSLGNSTTLRGWDKYDISPLGGERMFHSSVEYRYSHVAVFFDTGSVWDRNTESKIRYSTGFGIHSDNSFLTVGFPLNSDGADVTFMAGVRF
ncbi:MAG TPA: BamA/TamA family outer membrane protein [Vicinamibacterales bacterium]|nr:BamA/TamA family outer membrane protein [Vicinamibacterales bacterium]